MPKSEQNLLGQIHFDRRASSWPAMSWGLGVIVAAAIFVLLDQVAGIAGSALPTAFLLAAALVGLNCLGYAELAVSSPRSGGAYVLVREATTQEILPFITGWTLTLSGLGLSALLAQGAARYVTALLSTFLSMAIPLPWVASTLVLLTVAVHDLRRRGHRRVGFTIPLLIVLFVLTALSIGGRNSGGPRVTVGRADQAMLPLLAAFAALELVSGYQQQARRRVVTLPRSLLLVPVLTAAIGIVVAVAITRGTRPVDGVASGGLVALWAGQIAGQAGQVFILIAGALVLAFSLARISSVVTRQVFSMSRDGFWPRWLQWVNSRYGIPVRLIVLVAVAVAGGTWVPSGVLARVTGLLYVIALGLVNLALAQRHSRPVTPSNTRTRVFDSVEREASGSQPVNRPRRRFALPFHPWIPALTVAVDLLVLSLWDLTSIVLGLVCLLIGAGIYLAYARGRRVEAQDGVTVFKSADSETSGSVFRVLVPIANPATAEALLHLAGQIAQANNGDVLALQVLVVPETVPLEAGSRHAANEHVLLEHALSFADREQIPLQAVTRAARSVAQGIVGTARDEGVDLIVMGWKETGHGHVTSLGTVTDAVLRDATCEVMVIRVAETQPIHKILVPTAGGPHAQAAAKLAAVLARMFDAEVSFIYVQSGPATKEQLDSARERITKSLRALSLNREPDVLITTAPSVVEGIVEAAKAHDIVLLGVSDESLLDRMLFGSVPLQVASRVKAVVLVQADRGITSVWSRKLLGVAFSALPRLNRDEQLEVRQTLSQAARPGVNYFVLTVLSATIAALGMLLNSPAVVIGAMLVAPLMSPMLAFSLGMVLGDLRMIRFSTEAIFKGVALAVILAAFIGVIAPVKAVTSEMLARAQPTLLDLAVALASGFAGAYAVARKGVGAALPGVAIAAALMPPLVTVGLGLTVGDPRVAFGALLLFINNVAAISLAGGVVFILLGVRPRVWGAESRRRLRMRLTASLIILAIVAAPLGVIMVRTARDAARARIVSAVVGEQVSAEGSELVGLETERNSVGLRIVATVRSDHSLSQAVAADLAAALNARLHKPVEVEIVVLPVIRAVTLPD